MNVWPRKQISLWFGRDEPTLAQLFLAFLFVCSLLWGLLLQWFPFKSSFCCLVVLAMHEINTRLARIQEKKMLWSSINARFSRSEGKIVNWIVPFSKLLVLFRVTAQGTFYFVIWKREREREGHQTPPTIPPPPPPHPTPVWAAANKKMPCRIIVEWFSFIFNTVLFVLQQFSSWVKRVCWAFWIRQK